MVSVTVDMIFGTNQRQNGSPAFYWETGISLLGIVIALLVAIPILGNFEDARRDDRYTRREQLLQETLQPWLEETMGFTDPKEARFAGYDLTNEREDSWSTSARLNEKNNKLGSFDIGLAMHGFRLKSQYLRVWRWGTPVGDEIVTVPS